MTNSVTGKSTQDFALILEPCNFGTQEAKLPIGDVLPRCRLRRWRMLALLV